MIEKNDFVEIRSIRFTHGDIFSVVDSFYKVVATDPLLSVPFQSVEDWPHHIDKLTHFWWTRFGGKGYLETSYDPVTKHYEAGFNEIFLQHWLSLFSEILVTNLTPEQSQLWKSIATSMGSALHMKNEMMKNYYFKDTV